MPPQELRASADDARFLPLNLGLGPGAISRFRALLRGIRFAPGAGDDMHQEVAMGFAPSEEYLVYGDAIEAIKSGGDAR